MSEILKYLGRTVHLEVALRTDGWNWAYSIGGGQHVGNPDTPLPSRNMALNEATNAAILEINNDVDAAALAFDTINKRTP